ncbi:RlpA-like double-psi beta-barrel-protein domain-containing protein-containing protein, partial [Chytriomyces sp. MP71]
QSLLSQYQSTDNTGNALGACGNQVHDSDFIVAVSDALYSLTIPDGNPNHASVCGRCIQVTGPGTPFRVTVQDRCGGCSFYGLDFTPSGFIQIGPLSKVGRGTRIHWLTVS